MQRYETVAHGILASAVGLAMAACGGISDCKDDVAKCTAMLNANGAACAQAFQLKQSERKRRACEKAIDAVEDAQAKEAIPGLLAVLAAPHTSVPGDKHRTEAAKALGAIGDAQAVGPLGDAFDLSAGTSNDARDKNANYANEAIAKALGEIGDQAAVPKLLEAVNNARDKQVVLAAVRSLGSIGAESAVDALEKIALNDNNKFMRKNAVIALGDIGSPKAIDTLIRMMFVEYQGVSFYREASYGLFLIGPEAIPALLETLEGKNEAVNAIFEKTGGIGHSAVVAKVAVVLGDLRDPRAVEPLVKEFKDAGEKRDPLVLAQVPMALGFLRADAAVEPLSKEMGTIDASIREPVMRALNQIGDRSVVPEMIEAMTAEDFIKKCMKMGNSKGQCSSDVLSRARAQKAAADFVYLLAGAEHLEALGEAVEAESNDEIKKYFEKRYEVAKLAGECKDDAQCWAKKLKSKSMLEREKAAWELARLKDPATLDALVDALDDPKPKSRSAAIMAYFAYGDDRAIDEIEKQLEDEKSSADFIRVNEDLKRLLVHLKRNQA